MSYRYLGFPICLCYKMGRSDHIQMNKKNALVKMEKIIRQLPSPIFDTVKHTLHKEFTEMLTTVTTTDDIDGEGNPPPKVEECLTVLNFLIAFYAWMHETYRIAPPISHATCMTDAVFDIMWQTEDYKLLLGIHVRENYTGWYGTNKLKNKTPEQLIETKNKERVPLQEHKRITEIPEYFLKFPE